MSDTPPTPSPHVTGDHNRFTTIRDIYNLGGNIQINSDSYIDPEFKEYVKALSDIQGSDFFPLDKDKLPPCDPAPNAMGEFIDTLQNHRLLILSGDPTVNKERLARHTASCLHEDLGNSLENSIKQWNESGTTHMITALLRQKTSTILILLNLLPQHINHDLQEFRRVVRSCGHYVIVTVENNRSWFSIGENPQRPYWKEVGADFYNPEYLLNVFEKTLEDLEEQLPQHILDDAFFDKHISNQPISTIAQKLKTPENIYYFVTTLGERISQNRENQDIASKWSRTASKLH